MNARPTDREHPPAPAVPPVGIADSVARSSPSAHESWHVPSDDRFEAAVHANADDLYRYAYWLCRNPRVAEGLVSDAFQQSRRTLANTPDDRDARCGLFQCIRWEYARRTPCRLSVDGVSAAPSGSTAEPIDNHTSILRRRLGALPLVYLEPLVLYSLQFSVIEIADLLGTKPDDVRDYLSAARGSLQPTSC